MKYTKKLLSFSLLLGLLTLPFNLKASQPQEEEEVFSQSAKINQTVHELESLFILMQERLSLMHEIARYKWNAELLSTTLDAEELILLDERVQNEAFVSHFFEAQNLAAQKIQTQDFALFKAQNIKKFDEVKDFEHEIYPQLRILNDEILIAVNKLLVYTQNESLPIFLKDLSFSSFEHEGIDRATFDIAIDPLFVD